VFVWDRRLSLVRRYVLPRLRSQDSYSDFTGAMLQAVMVFYGLAVALIAVSVWQSYSDAAKLVRKRQPQPRAVTATQWIC